MTKQQIAILAALGLGVLCVLCFGGYIVISREGSYRASQAPTSLIPQVATEPTAESPTATSPPPGTAPLTEDENTRVRPADGMVMIRIPAGEFLMGMERSPALPQEKPEHTIYLDDYWMDQTEVSNAQYRLCVEAGGCVAPHSWSDANFDSDDQPVAGVIWENAQTYCQWVGARLPTEAEWEKGARGTDGRAYSWGDERWDGTQANMAGDEDGYDDRTAPVGSFPAGASPYSLLDMTGNVREWVADWYDSEYYAHSPAQNPTGPESGEMNMKVSRGGSYAEGGHHSRCTDRMPMKPDIRQEQIPYTLGFRCAAATPPGGEAAPPPPAEAPATSPVEQPPSQEGPPAAGFAWEDIPVYPGAREIMEEITPLFPSGSTDYEQVGIRNYETDDPKEKVADFYLAEMPKKGWEKIMHTPMGESVVSVWHKGDGELGTTIGIGEQEGKTYIAIIVGREK
jgi:sulfatase modifying factor 1